MTTVASIPIAERVPFLDVGATYTEIRAEIDRSIARVLDSGWFLLGESLAAFEREFARRCGVAHCVGVGSGLDALVLILRAADIGPGDEVLVPANTFVATWLAVTYVGATPVGVEPDPESYNMDPSDAARRITDRTRAVIPVHLYGQPAEMDALRTLCDQHGLRLFEDAAQAHGATYRGRPAGSLSDAAAWSFYPGKNLGAFGDGGAVTTNDDALAERISVLRNYGSRVKYVHDELGMNSRLDEIQSAVLLTKLAHLDEWNARRRAIAARYRDELAGAPLQLPNAPGHVESSWHLFVARVDGREAFRDHLRERGVETLVHYPLAPHLQPAYAGLGLRRGSYPIAERLQDEVVSLPIGPHMSDEQVSAVIDACRSFER